MSQSARRGKVKPSKEEHSKYFEEKSTAASKELAVANKPPVEQTPDSDINVTIITELQKFRQEVNESLEKLSEKVTNIDQTVSGLVRRISEAEDRISTLEDGHNRHTQLLSFLLELHRDRQLEARCEALENVQRRDNLRIYGIKEGSEEGDTVKWIEEFLRTTLQLPTEFDFRIERAHRSLLQRPTNPNASPRSFVLKFNSFKTKQLILQKAWQEKNLTYRGEKITMNHDYSPTLQKKRREYSGIKKQLKAKQIKFQSPYPAMLKVFVQEDTLVFHSAWEVAEGLKHLGITAELSEEERLEKDLHRLGWTASGMKNPRAQVAVSRG
ncbi:beta-1,3-N-acetylglucosaminyltransferase manic fringe isoform X2 [Alosa alosa]|uniref:beta-1,3-N-acetylglucosaminyltransferase manic fringe isoform X2 n=1 Tax=Alosa alosa TaxID=278164 RepID=UPI002015514C|nr:beta-1,3-N-acetylglucosaminyltransferase manic fringe isoform X2 [Alosa alosa]